MTNREWKECLVLSMISTIVSAVLVAVAFIAAYKMGMLS